MSGRPTEWQPPRSSRPSRRSSSLPPVRLSNTLLLVCLAALGCGGGTPDRPTQGEADTQNATMSRASSSQPSLTVEEYEKRKADKQEREIYAGHLPQEKRQGRCELPKGRVTDKRIELDGTIDFELDSDALTEASAPTLESLKKILVDNPTLTRVEVAGHADTSGEDAHNLDLTRRRADAVREWLITSGISPDRLVSMGYSSYCLKVDKEPTSAKNRRVELAIVERDKKVVDPGWGGCEAAEKKGLKKPKPGAQVATVAPPPKKGASGEWQPGQKLPTTLCGEPFPAAEVKGEYWAPAWLKPTEYSYGASNPAPTIRGVQHHLRTICQKDRDLEIPQVRFASQLIDYADTLTDKALRDDALGHALTMVRKAHRPPTSKTTFDEACLVEARISVRQGDLGFVAPLAECLKKDPSVRVSPLYVAWHALDIADAKKTAVDLSALDPWMKRAPETDRPLFAAVKYRIALKKGVDKETLFHDWYWALMDMGCTGWGPRNRWLLPYAPEFAHE